MTSWIEPPPKKRGCLGKGCLFIVIFLVLLLVAFFIGGYAGVRYVVTSSEPRKLPEIQTSEVEQSAVQARWNDFENASRNREITPPAPVLSPPSPDASPEATPVSPNRIELTANDINQLIAGSRKTRGKAYVAIENNVARVQVSIPLEKAGFRGRYLNGEFTVAAPADRNPRNLQVTQVSLSGGAASEAVLKALLGTHSVHSYVDEFASAHGITSFTIENNKVILEKSGGR